MNTNQYNASIDLNEQELFIVMPTDIDDLISLTERILMANDYERGLMLYHYLYERRNGKTHTEAVHGLHLIDRNELKQRMRYR